MQIVFAQVSVARLHWKPPNWNHSQFKLTPTSSRFSQSGNLNRHMRVHGNNSNGSGGGNGGNGGSAGIGGTLLT